MHSEPNTTFNPEDPHHFADLGEHHGHHITSAKVLIRVILALVILTALTVFASQFEKYLGDKLGVRELVDRTQHALVVLVDGVDRLGNDLAGHRGGARGIVAVLHQAVVEHAGGATGDWSAVPVTRSMRGSSWPRWRSSAWSSCCRR